MDPFLIAPIRVTSLADAVAERLRTAIINGDLRPGERLAEPAMATQLGVSRSPVREALQILKSEGLVTEYPNRGSYVWLPTPQDVDEIFSLRTMIETLASEWLVDHIRTDDVTEMENIIEEERQAIASGDLVRIMETDKNFHEYICTRSNHSRLKDWWNKLMYQWEVLLSRRARTNPDQVLQTVIDDHSAILKAIKMHNLSQVRELHLSVNLRVAENIKVMLNQKPG